MCCQQPMCQKITKSRSDTNNLEAFSCKPSDFSFAMIGRADIEGSKSDAAMNVSSPQASYPCGNFLSPLAKNSLNRKDR